MADLARNIREAGGLIPCRFIAEATPQQLALIGFPRAGSAAWTEAFLDGMSKRYGYAGFDPTPYRDARDSADEACREGKRKRCS